LAARTGGLAALTGLRFALALAVYISHVASPAGSTELVSTLMASGYFGVTFFFVLSGFVLTLNYWDRLGSREGLLDFAVSRLARIYPLYIVILLFLAALTGRSTDLPVHALALQAWHPDLGVAYAFNAPGWSIGVELFLYALLPLIIPLAAYVERRWSPVWLAAVAVLAMVALAALFAGTDLHDLPPGDPSSAHRWLYRTPLTRIGDFILGVVAARLYVGWRHDHRWGSVMVYGALLATIVFATSRDHLFSEYSWDISYAVPAMLLILGLALAPLNRVSRVLAHPGLVLLGEASFALYLTHWWLADGLGSGTWATSLDAGTIANEIGILVFVAATSVAIHLYFERPARTFIKTSVASTRKHLLHT
jgi:peptidoglycan/LPS O-acetylase OafA/YrhL